MANLRQLASLTLRLASLNLRARSVATGSSSGNLKGGAARPFRVLGLQQIAVGARDKSRLSALWGPDGLLGLPRTGSFRSERENVDEDILRAGSGPLAVEVDIMAPLDAARAPRVHEPPLNHVGLWVDRLRPAVEWLEKKGVRFTPGGVRKGAGGHEVCFVHPKGNDAFPLSGEGVLIELIQAPPDVIEAFDRAASAQ